MAVTNANLSNEPDEHIVEAIERYSRIALQLVVLLSLATLACWLIPGLAERVPSFWLMLKPDTALGLALGSVSLWLGRAGMPARARTAAQILALAVLSIGLSSAFRYLSGTDTGIDSPFAATVDALRSERMSPQSTVALVLIGPALLLVRSSKSTAGIVADGFTLVLAAFVLIAGASWLFDAAGLFRLGDGRVAAPQALAGFVLLTLVAVGRRARYGLFAVLIGIGIGSRVARTVLPIAVALPFLLAALRATAVQHAWLSSAFGAALSAALQAFFMFCVVLWTAWRINGLERELRTMSLVDELTGIHNRRGFYLLAEQAARTARRLDQQVTVFFADLDGLKKINDGWGHDAGSRFIADAARLFLSCFRDGDIVGRIGGDEFAAVTIHRAGQSATVLRRIEDAVEAYNARNEHPYRLGLSVGCSELKQREADSLEAAVGRADAAMYAHKRRGREPLPPSS